MTVIDCEQPEAPAPELKPLLTAFVLTFAIFIVEVAGGWLTGSLALMADAVHMGVDLMALALGLLAAYVSAKPPDAKRTFGYKRVEVLAALANGVVLLVATGIILHEAYHRFSAPQAVLAGPMLVVACVGLACNLVSGAILHRHSHGNINVRGVFLHVAADALGSVGVIASGVVILLTGWLRADPVASFVICLFIIATSLLLVKDSVHILLEGAPSHLDIQEIREALASIPGVRDVHDLHLWSLSKGRESLSGHLTLEPGEDTSRVLGEAAELLKTRFGLLHVTLQMEASPR